MRTLLGALFCLVGLLAASAAPARPAGPSGPSLPHRHLLESDLRPCFDCGRGCLATDCPYCWAALCPICGGRGCSHLPIIRVRTSQRNAPNETPTPSYGPEVRSAPTDDRSPMR